MLRKALLLLWVLIIASAVSAQKFTAALSADTLERYDFIEVSLRSKRGLPPGNPFRDVQLWGRFWKDGQDTINVEGFCDAQNGSEYKMRFMPDQVGLYHYGIDWVTTKGTHRYSGRFFVRESDRKGPLRIDAENPSHFIYEHTREHFFWNGTTTYWMLGWKDEEIISYAIDRLAKLGVNRIRVAINGRAHGGDRWSEPTVVESEKFTFKLNPWVADKPDDLDHPEFDVSRFNVSHWQKLDRLVQRAREQGIIVSLIFYVDGLDHGCDPFKKENMGNEYEQMYYAYAAARYAAFENVMWDIANEYHLFRTPEWAEKMGSFLKSKDPYQHLISVHGNADFPFRKSPWVDVIMHQSWDECGGYPFVIDAKKRQADTGRMLPVVNEEYGYEGHYPPWGCGPTTSKSRPDGRSGLNRSRLAWEICMAGAYQTTGETAEFGTGAGEDTGGGWINGRGNDQMTMLFYYRIMKDCFERTEYWRLSPRNDLVSFGNLCLANEGREYLIYTRAPHCRVKLPGNQKYKVIKIDPLTGEETSLPDADSNVDNQAWQYRQNLEGNWVFILKRI